MINFLDFIFGTPEADLDGTKSRLSPMAKEFIRKKPSELFHKSRRAVSTGKSQTITLDGETYAVEHNAQ